MPIESTEVLTAINPRNWEYVNIFNQAIMSKFQNFMTTYAEKGNPIGRQIIKEIYRCDIGEGVIATIIWGYPKGRYPGGKGFNAVFAQVPEITSILEDAKTRKGDITADEICCRQSRIAGMGISTYTKMLYLSDTIVKEGVCLIYDQMVMRAISRSQDPELLEIGRSLGPCIRKQKDGKDGYHTYPAAIQKATYGPFLRAVGSMALRDGRHPADVEQALFLEAPKGRLAV
jgi:hypothetical protein